MRRSTNLWLAQTSTPSVHEDITQIATLQVIKQCHKWDKRGRPETRRRYRESLAPLLRFSDMERVRRTSNPVRLKWGRIGYDLWHALIFAGIRYSCVRKRNVAAKGRGPTRTYSASKGLSIQSLRRLGKEGRLRVGIWRLDGGDSNAITGRVCDYLK